MIAIGKNIDGEEVEVKMLFDVILICTHKKLIEIKIPDLVQSIYCSDNLLTELKLPDNIKYIECYDNPIKEIRLPKKIKKAWIPMNCKVLNLSYFKNKKKVEIKFM